MDSNYKINFNENIRYLKLKNGLSVILDSFENSQNAAIGFFLKNGSRDENKNQLGYSHFCEHMLFKGTDKHGQKEISKMFDSMGGFINAYTTHEHVVLYNKVPAFYLNDTVKMMHEMFTDSVFSPNEVETERDVILNEIRVEDEDPHDKIHECFMKNIFSKQSLGLPIIGNKRSIKNASRESLFDFYKEKFSIDDLLVVISGKIDDKVIMTLENLSFRKKNNAVIQEKALQGKNNYFFTKHTTEQAHIILGTSKYDLTEEMEIKSGLLNIIIGESMSSRFFQKIREDLGLCYTIYSFFNKFREENLFGLYLSVLPKNTNIAINAVSKVFKDLIKKGITTEELEQAKSQKNVEIILNSDQLQKRIQRLAFMQMNSKKIFTINEAIDIIKNTSVDDLNLLIKKVFVHENFVLQILNKNEIKIKEWGF